VNRTGRPGSCRRSYAICGHPDRAGANDRSWFLIDALQGERERALAAFRKGRAIIARLREASPDHAILASDLAWFGAEIAKLSG
jgi:hypothetical protein